MLLIQYLWWRWTKAERGAQNGAAVRAVPEAYSFGAPELPNPGEHWLSKSAGERFSARKLETKALHEFHLFHSKLEIRFDGQCCHVLRRESSVPLLTIKLGETGRVRIQGNNASYSHHWQERYVCSVALLERYDSEVFRLRPFTHTFDDLPDLRFAPSSTPNSWRRYSCLDDRSAR